MKGGVTRLMGAGVLGCLAASGPLRGLEKEYDHRRLLYILDEEGNEVPVKTVEAWNHRRIAILGGMQAAMGPLPSRESLPDLD